MEKCYVCEKGIMEKKKVDFHLYGELIGKFDAEVCPVCKEKFFDEETSQKIDATTKAKGLWGLEAETSIGQSGDSLMVRINKQLAQFLNLQKGERIKIRPEDRKKITIEIG
ncbi:MAG: hypothetical protein AABX82_01405 [Nanoarchaeota archaeon]